MGAKEIILMRLEELKKRGIRMYPLKKLIEDLATEIPYSPRSLYVAIEELELLKKIKMVNGRGRYKIIILNEQANNNNQQIKENGVKESINNN